MGSTARESQAVGAGDARAKRPGRRRDPEIDERARVAVLMVYSRAGLSGLTFNAIAREAQVGKPALYRRWESPLHLLIDAFAQLQMPGPRDCGSLRADLQDYGRQFALWFAENDVRLSVYLALDRREDEALDALYHRQIYRPRMDAARAMTERALRRGEIDSAADALLAVELLLGALNMRWLFTAQSRVAELHQSLPGYVDSAVDAIVSGVAPTVQPEMLRD